MKIRIVRYQDNNKLLYDFHISDKASWVQAVLKTKNKASLSAKIFRFLDEILKD